MFTLFFLNFPLPKIWDRTSQKIDFKICSSIFSCLLCLIAFLARQIPYIMELKINRHKTPIKVFVFHLLQPSLITASQIGGQDQRITSLHASFPNYGTETTGEKEMVTALKKTTAKKILRVTCVAPRKQPITSR